MVHMTAHTGNPTSPDQVQPGSRPVLHFDPALIASARDTFADASERVAQLVAECEAISSPLRPWGNDEVSRKSAARFSDLREDCVAVLKAYTAQLNTAMQVFDTTMKWYTTTDEGKAKAMTFISPRLTEEDLRHM